MDEAHEKSEWREFIPKAGCCMLKKHRACKFLNENEVGLMLTRNSVFMLSKTKNNELILFPLTKARTRKMLS